jgi:hypothetical protein
MLLTLKDRPPWSFWAYAHSGKTCHRMVTVIAFMSIQH